MYVDIRACARLSTSKVIVSLYLVYGRDAATSTVAIISRAHTDLEPCEHEFPRRELGLANLISHDE